MALINNSFGDTIVEVLIAIVILSLILTGAYVTSNDSLNNVRDAQERVQALGVAQNQIEDLRALASTAFAVSTNKIYSGETPADNSQFCFQNDAIVNASTNNCLFQARYTAIITPEFINPSGTYSFQIKVTWPSINSGVVSDVITIVYRVSI